MKVAITAVAAFALLPAALTNPLVSDYSIAERHPDVDLESWERSISIAQELEERDTHAEAKAEAEALHHNDLEKRRGGGGGGRGGGGSSSSGSSSSGSSGSRGGSSGSTGSSGSRGPTTASPSFAGGSRFGGGSTTAYTAGGRSPSGISPFPLVAGAGLGFAGAALLWPHPVYAYNWGTPYHAHGRNRTNGTNTRVTRQDDTETVPVTCLCDQTLACGCDDNGNSTYLDSLFGPGYNNSLQPQVATIQTVNGSDAVVLNGSLPNGDDGDDGDDSGALSIHRMQTGGYVMMVAGMAVSLWLL